MPMPKTPEEWFMHDMQTVKPYADEIEHLKSLLRQVQPLVEQVHQIAEIQDEHRNSDDSGENLDKWRGLSQQIRMALNDGS